MKIGKRCKLETESYITALSEIEDGCFIAPEVTFTNDNFLGRTKERFKFHKGVTVKRGGRIGANVTVLPGITIGADALVAAGSVVTRDVPDKKLVMGSPAESEERRSLSNSFWTINNDHAFLINRWRTASVCKGCDDRRCDLRT